MCVSLSSSISSHFQEPIRFKVKDKEHTLGTVTVPLSGLSSSANKLWLPLQPHKKASEVHGSLQVGCWVASCSEKERLSDEVHLQNSHALHQSFSSSRHAGRGPAGEQADEDKDEVTHLNTLYCCHVNCCINYRLKVESLK